MIRKRLGFYIFMAFMLISFDSIRYNAVPGSRNEIIAYSIWGGILFAYIVLKTKKNLKSQKQDW